MAKKKQTKGGQTIDINQQHVEAVGNGNIDAVRRYLEAGVDRHTRGTNARAFFLKLGTLPCDPWPIMGEIIREGADITVQDEVGSTILHMAAGADDVEAVELVLGHGTGIEVLDHIGETVSNEAVIYGALCVVEVLIQRGADVFAKPAEGEAPKNRFDYSVVVTCDEIEFERALVMAMAMANAKAEGAEGQDDEVAE